MAMDAETRREIEGLKSIIRELRAGQQRQAAATRTPQLGHSSIDSGALEVRDPQTGATRLRIGWQPDGRPGLGFEGGDPSPAPSAPVVAAAPVGLMVQWDGQMANPDTDLPSDLDHVSVHVSPTSGFTPSQATFQGTIPRAGGLFPVVPLDVGTTYYVLLVPVGTGGVEGAPSGEASGVPEGVGGVPGPGSITETEIADDAISTPKLQALAVTAAKIVAGAIEAGHITAGAVTAAKLAAEIVLGTRIIAGDPAGARVEMDSTGFRKYGESGELQVIFEGDDAIFSGSVVASEITGSRFSMASPSGATGTIESTSTGVATRVQSGAMGAALTAAGAQANFIARSDVFSTSSPLAGFAAFPDSVSFVLDSSALSSDGLPSVTGTATPTASQLAIWSVRNSLADPRVTIVATPTEARGEWTSGTGSSIRVDARADFARISATPEPSTVGQPAANSGTIHAFRRATTDAPTLSLQSPISTSGPGASRASAIQLEGANTARPSTVINQSARMYYFQGELVDGSTDTTSNGAVELADTHSFLAPRHAPVRTDMVTAPSGTFSGGWNAFSNAAYPAISFKTGWSGRVRITITAAAGNTTTTTSTVHFGFALAGASSVPAAVGRAWSARGVLMQCCSRTIYLDLTGNASYTLTPSWNISSGSAGAGVTFYTIYEHSIVVEPLS